MTNQGVRKFQELHFLRQEPPCVILRNGNKEYMFDCHSFSRLYLVQSNAQLRDQTSIVIGTSKPSETFNLTSSLVRKAAEEVRKSSI